MSISRHLQVILVVSLVISLFIGTIAPAEDVLSGSKLLKAMREKHDKASTPAYANRLEESGTDELLTMVPIDTLFCVRVNNFDYSVGMIDQFLTGISPIPLGVSALVRMQLAGILGSPDLKGLNTAGDFIVFAAVLPGKSPEGSPTPNIFVGGFFATTDYQELINGNPNCSEPDENGISKITSQQLPQMLAKQVGNYVLVGASQENGYDALMEIAKSTTAEGKQRLLETLGRNEAKQAAKEPLWVYADVQFISQTFGPAIVSELGGVEMAVASIPSGGEGPPMDAMDLEELLGEINALTIAVNPKPDVLNLALNISAVPGTETADEFSVDSSMMRKLVDAGAKRPDEMGTEIDAISALIPDAKNANLIGKYDALSQLKALMPETEVEGDSGVAYAVRLGTNKLSFDVAVPKQLVRELAVLQTKMMQQPMEGATAPASQEDTWMEEPTSEQPMWQPAPPEETTPIAIEVPPSNVQGHIMKTDVALTNALFGNNILSIYSGDSWAFSPGVVIFLFEVDKGAIPSNSSFLVEPEDSPTENSPQIHFRWIDPKSDKITNEVMIQGYKLDLNFGQSSDGIISGEISLEVPDKDTSIQGEFHAKIEN